MGLFTSSDNCVRRTNDNSSLFPTKYKLPQRLVNSSGNLITITDSGTIIPILEQEEIIKLLYLESNDTKKNKILLNRSHEVVSSSFIPTTIPTSTSAMNYRLVLSEKI